MYVDAFQYIVDMCIESEKTKVLIIYDNTTKQWIQLLEQVLCKLGKIIDKVKLDIAHCHGEEPSLLVRNRMLESEAIMCMTCYSLAHTEARKLAEKEGIPFLSMPGYTFELLKNPAVYADYESKISQVNEYAYMLSAGKYVEVISAKGTHLFMDISGRKGNSCPGLTNKEFLLGSPPDIEANIAPLERKTQGQIIVDGSITDQRIGLLQTPVHMNIVDGMVKTIISKDVKIEKEIKQIFYDVGSLKASIIGEFGIGFNDKAILCGNMLIDEGTLGCVHFGIGSNWTIGGENRVNFHLDFVLKEATVLIDNRLVIKEGKILYG